ncbi:MAG: DUF748 domain-containing protein [Candidatus Binatia bacterium]
MKKALVWLAAVFGLLVVLLVSAAFFIDDPLRRRTEDRINGALKGYTVRIGKLDFHPLGFSLDLEDSVIIQDAEPEPPIAQIPNLTASVNWKALLFGRVVADFEINNPKVFLNLKQSRSEIQDEVPVEKRGWQAAVEAIYPLKINELVVTGGELTYVDQGSYRPLELKNVNFRTYNIRNVRSQEGEYPSEVYLEGTVFESGKIVLQGNADFLAEPHVAFKAGIQAEQIALDYFRPITERYHFSVRRGVLSTAGTIEYTKNKKILNVPRLDIHKLAADYVHNKPAASPTAELAKKTDRVIREHSNEPGLEVQVSEVNVLGGELGIINKASEPEYRLFITDAQIKIQNLTNQAKEGTSVVTANGKFMNSGKARALVRLRPTGKSPNFDLQMSIEPTNMKALNPLFKAYANFDVVAGQFSLYSEIAVRDGLINGYVKPLFKDVDVYDPKQDRKKGLFGKIYEGIIGGLSWVLENQPREEVATTTKISGKLSNPETSTLDVVLGLVQNAFFKAILPGLERSVETPVKSKK